jgi:hypothetical protein
LRPGVLENKEQNFAGLKLWNFDRATSENNIVLLSNISTSKVKEKHTKRVLIFLGFLEH